MRIPSFIDYYLYGWVTCLLVSFRGERTLWLSILLKLCLHSVRSLILESWPYWELSFLKGCSVFRNVGVFNPLAGVFYYCLWTFGLVWPNVEKVAQISCTPWEFSFVGPYCRSDWHFSFNVYPGILTDTMLFFIFLPFFLLSLLLIFFFSSISNCCGFEIASWIIHGSFYTRTSLRQMSG